MRLGALLCGIALVMFAVAACSGDGDDTGVGQTAATAAGCGGGNAAGGGGGEGGGGGGGTPAMSCDYAGSYVFCVDGANICERCRCWGARCTVSKVGDQGNAKVGYCIDNPGNPGGLPFVCSVPCGEPPSALCP